MIRTNIATVFNSLLALRKNSKGKANGSLISFQYKRFEKVTERAKKESLRAKKAGMKMCVYTGHLERAFLTKGGHRCITMTVFQRDCECPNLKRNPNRLAYRTFNLDLGKVEDFHIVHP